MNTRVVNVDFRINYNLILHDFFSEINICYSQELQLLFLEDTKKLHLHLETRHPKLML